MQIEFLGHACFRITLESGRNIVIDPYEPNGLGGKLRYQPIAVEADLVLITHEHRDHSDTSWVGGDFTVIREPYQDDELSISVFDAAHDEFGGNLRSGFTRLFLIEADGVRVLHCGDLGERLTSERAGVFGMLDALIVPVGGYYTLGAEGAAELARLIRPRYVLPCHYRTAAADIPELAPVELFTRRFRNSRWGGCVLEQNTLDPSLPVEEPLCVVVLAPAGLLMPLPSFT
jgi:L-ascorbate metabolism protein UlaG (beta-lactamase superfamily)